MIILHFQLPPQFTYELFHIYLTPKLDVIVTFRLANLLREHMKTPMRSLRDVMSVPIFY